VIVMVLFVVAAAAGGAAAEDRVAALADHLRRHPEAEATDAYKFLHQGVFGPGHMVSDRAAAARYLEGELAGLSSGDAFEPLCEPLGGDPSLVRIHLRPLVSAGHDPDHLVDAFVASANSVRGNTDDMVRALDASVAWLSTEGRDRLGAELSQLKSELETEAFPALHHSRAYSDAYHPAYRVVAADLAEDRGWCK
jgi:hypothetical protein